MNAKYLLTFFKTDQQRRQRVIFGILKNKLTVSTSYNGLRYGILDQIGLFPKIDKAEFDGLLDELTKQELVLETAPGQLILTEKGELHRQQYAKEHYVLSQRKEIFQANVVNFRDAFLLANQVVSELAYHNARYYPVPASTAVKQTIKQWYALNHSTDLPYLWAKSLQNFLSQISEEDANRITNTWIGHAIPGLVATQLQFPNSWDAQDYYLWELDCYAKWSAQLRDSENTALRQLWKVFERRDLMSNSMGKTYNDLLAGQSLEQMANQRHLKLGTLREHLLSAAILLPLVDFNYDLFLTDTIKTDLASKLSGSIDEWQFEMVRKTSDPVEFFYFRLYSIQQTKLEAGQ